MLKYYPQILGIIDKLNDWNEKLNGLVSDKGDNVFVGTIILFAIIAVAFFGISELSKK